MDDLTWTSARELAAAIRTRRLSAVELMEAVLDRIDEVDDRVGAIVTRLPRDEALARAVDADRAVAAGEPLGPLHGLPTAVKDLMDVAGMRLTHGSRLFADHVSSRDSLLAARLRAAGALIVGKTNTPEFGAGTLTFNPLFGTTGSPHDLAKNAGGSSGGAAAAVAAGMLPFADGSDSGGSLRHPASMCGVVGLRPTPGRIPSGRPGDGWSPHGVVGPMARTVDDAALVLSALAGPDARAPLALGEPGSSFAEVPVRGAEGLRVAWDPDVGGLPVEAEVTAVLDELRAKLEAAGAEVVDVALDWPDVDAAWEVIELFEFAVACGPAVDRDASLVRDDVVENVRLGRALAAERLAWALGVRTEVHRRAAALLADVDVLAVPAVQVAAVDRDATTVPAIGGERFERYYGWQRSACRVTVTAHPALVVPAGFTPAGHPVGVQLVGRYRGEAALLGAGRVVEAVAGATGRRPLSAAVPAA